MNEKTLRQQIMALLEGRALDARGLSAELGVREKEIHDHLPHVELTAARAGRRFVVHPSRCGACGFEFRKRKRLTRPSRCPRCRGSRLSQPFFEIR